MLLLAVMLACGDKDGSDDTAGGGDGGATDGGVADGGTGDGGTGDGGTGDGGTSSSDSLVVAAVGGNLGAIAWVSTLPDGYADGDVTIQAQRDGTWVDACAGAVRCVLDGTADLVRAATGDGAHVSAEVGIDTVTPSLGVNRVDRAFFADEVVDLRVTADNDGTPASAYLSRLASGTTRWWSQSSTSWVGTAEAVDPTSLEVLPYAASITKPVYTLLIGVPAADWASEADLGSVVIAGIASSETSVYELGHKVLWGDPHVHTDLSQDGCEDPDAMCQGPDTAPAGDVFYNADEVGVDWIAMTDHAEWTTYIGSPGAEEIDIWTRQLEVVQQAEAAYEAGDIGVMPFIGYEWTYTSQSLDEDGYRMGGHRTVIFENTEVCHDLRIGATSLAPDHDKGTSTTVVTSTNPVWSNTVNGWRETIAAASVTCGDDQRVLFIAHHPALRRPQPVDWRREANVPDPTWEPVVEIASEHGTSECFDPSAEHCDFRIYDPDEYYYPQGSYQAALMAGLRLGVAGGTDAHDAWGASFDDGPCCTSVLLTDGTLACQNYQGAATGVLTPAPYDRAALFDGMFARKTYATTGPMLPVRAWLSVGSEHFLPGRVVEATGDRDLTVSLVDAYDPAVYTRVEIDLLNESGERLAGVDDITTDDDAILEYLVEPGDCSACYVRVRLYEDGDEEGERIWLSPWFF